MKQSLAKIVLTACLAIVGTALMAQCPMCKMAAESNLNNGGTAGAGLNFGILYMLALPYILIFGIGYFWYRNRKKIKGEEKIEKPEVFEFSDN